MKIKVIFCCVMMVVLYRGPLWGSDLMSFWYRSDHVKQLEREKVQLQSERAQLSDELSRVKQQLQDAQDKAKTAQSELSDAKAQVDAATTRINELEWWKWIVYGLVFIVLIGVAFLFVMGRRKPAIVDNHDDELPKCPRCGWKYACGETKCRNCGTRF